MKIFITFLLYSLCVFSTVILAFAGQIRLKNGDILLEDASQSVIADLKPEVVNNNFKLIREAGQLQQYALWSSIISYGFVIASVNQPDNKIFLFGAGACFVCSMVWNFDSANKLASVSDNSMIK